MPGILDMMGYIQDQGEQGRKRGLAALVGKAYNAPQAERQQILGTVAARGEPGMAYDAQKHFEGLDDTARQKLGQYAVAFDALPDEQKPQAYPQLAAQAQALGIPAPPQWNPAFAPNIQKLAQALGAGGPGGNVQSTYVNDQGQRVAIMRDGSVQVLGANAPNNQIIDTGNGFFGVNRSNLQAAPVMTGGQAAPQQGAPQAPQHPGMQQVQYATDDGTPIPPEEQAAAQAAMAAAARGEDVNIAVGGSGGAPQMPPALDYQSGGQLRSVPKPPSPIEQQRLQLAQEAAQRAAEAQQLAQRGNAPAGYRFKMDGSLEHIPGAPLPPAAAKTNTALAAKMPQLQNAIRGMDRIDSALSKLDGAMVNTGPLDQYAQKFTPAGQELEAAVGSIQNSILALTRVPGIGSQSDLEARVAMLQYPSLDKPPEVNKRTLANLKLFLRDLQSAYQTATQGGGQPSQDQPPASGWSIQAVP